MIRTASPKQLTRRPPLSRFDGRLLGVIRIRVLGGEGERPQIWVRCKGAHFKKLQACFELLGAMQIDGKLRIFVPLRCSVFPGILRTILSRLSFDILRPRLQVDS